MANVLYKDKGPHDSGAGDVLFNIMEEGRKRAGAREDLSFKMGLDHKFKKAEMEATHGFNTALTTLKHQQEVEQEAAMYARNLAEAKVKGQAEMGALQGIAEGGMQAGYPLQQFFEPSDPSGADFGAPGGFRQADPYAAPIVAKHLFDTMNDERTRRRDIDVAEVTLAKAKLANSLNLINDTHVQRGQVLGSFLKTHDPGSVYATAFDNVSIGSMGKDEFEKLYSGAATVYETARRRRAELELTSKTRLSIAEAVAASKLQIKQLEQVTNNSKAHAARLNTEIDNQSTQLSRAQAAVENARRMADTTSGDERRRWLEEATTLHSQTIALQQNLARLNELSAKSLAGTSDDGETARKMKQMVGKDVISNKKLFPNAKSLDPADLSPADQKKFMDEVDRRLQSIGVKP